MRTSVLPLLPAVLLPLLAVFQHVGGVVDDRRLAERFPVESLVEGVQHPKEVPLLCRGIGY